MAHFTYGPVELHLVGFAGERPDPAVARALMELVEGGTLRLLDLVLVTKSEFGEIAVADFADVAADYGIEGIELLEAGIASAEDIDEMAEYIPPGESAVIVAFELAYMRVLAEKVAAAGGAVLRTERIPAAVVNGVLDVADES